MKSKDAEIEQLRKSNEEITEENAEKVNQYGKNIGELSGQIEELEKFLVEKDEQIKNLQSSQSSKSAELDDILVEKNKCITEMSEQIEAEIHSKNQAIKTQEKTLQKYEDLKATLSDEKTKAEAVRPEAENTPPNKLLRQNGSKKKFDLSSNSNSPLFVPKSSNIEKRRVPFTTLSKVATSEEKLTSEDDGISYMRSDQLFQNTASRKPEKRNCQSSVAGT